MKDDRITVWTVLTHFEGGINETDHPGLYPDSQPFSCREYAVEYFKSRKKNMIDLFGKTGKITVDDKFLPAFRMEFDAEGKHWIGHIEMFIGTIDPFESEL